MQDQNITSPIVSTPPSAGVSDATMGIPNLAASTGGATDNSQNLANSNFTVPDPAMVTLPAAGATTTPATPATPSPVKPGADVSTMGIPPLQPPADATKLAGSDATKATGGGATKATEDTKVDNSAAKTSDTKEKKPKAPSKVAQSDLVKKIIDKIRSSENILIAVSKNPTVDDIAAAVGLTLYLDGIQRHVTAIYSGRITEGLEFLQPEATFETNTDSLQDFIVALSKDKADHLRYKLEGDYVKVFITPYRAKITEDDLTFSHGEYNVDFVIALDVASADELDEALKEHGRIMHSASTVNITTSEPGKFGEIDWSNPAASSVCEMVTQLILEMQGDEKPLDKDIATALLTGIVAATDRFSNSRTNSDTLSLAAKLMEMGADQQLITANISGNEISQEEPETEPNDNLMISHEEAAPDYEPTIVMPTVNTDISAVDPAVNPTSVPEMPVMAPLGTNNGTANATGAAAMSEPTAPAANQEAPAGNTPAMGASARMEIPGAGAMNPMTNTMSPTMSTTNPAANLANDMSAELGPEPAAMSIPGMAPQESLMPPAGMVSSNEGVPMPPADNMMPPATESVMPPIPPSDNSAMPPMPPEGIMPPMNGELANRPDSVLPPPPMPPVDEMTMAPPA